MLNTGKKMSNTSLGQRQYNRTSAPQGAPKNLMDPKAARTGSSWMQNQPPLSPSRNTNLSSKGITDNIIAQQQSGYTRSMTRGVHSPEALKINDSASDFGNGATNNVRLKSGAHDRQGSHKRTGNSQANEARAYQ